MAINLLQNTSSENPRVLLQQNIFFPIHFGLTDALSVVTGTGKVTESWTELRM